MTSSWLAGILLGVSYDPATRTHQTGRLTLTDADVANQESARREARDQQKAAYHAYRDAAQRAVALAQGLPGLHLQGVALAVSVSAQAEVQVVEEGAFVEARIWVPKAAVSL